MIRPPRPSSPSLVLLMLMFGRKMDALLLQPPDPDLKVRASQSRLPAMNLALHEGRRCLERTCACWLIRAEPRPSPDEGRRCHGEWQSENSALWTYLSRKVLGGSFESIKNASGGGVCVGASGGLPVRSAPGQTNTAHFALIKR